MPSDITEIAIKESLKRTYHPGKTASVDGYAEMYAGVHLHCAAVLIPLACRDDEWHLVFTRRTETVEHHKGQVSFPGGGCEIGESTPEQTALREAEEEIGLKPGNVRLLGRLNDILTITHFRVTPVVGIISWPFDIHLEPAEVERIFSIPLFWLANPENWDEKDVTPSGVTRSFPVIYYHPYDGEILWGATARMTRNFLEVLGLLNR